MKTIQIPMNSNPFTVVINNHEYSYTAGETVEVPDEVAAAIEDALELEPKPIRYLSNFEMLIDGSITELDEKSIEGITTISEYAFYLQKNLKKVTLPKSVEMLNSYAFYACSNLTTVILDDGLNSIRGNAFARCSKLKSVHLPITPPDLASENAFDSINASCVFYCRSQESLDAYKAATIWSTLAGTYSFVVEA